MRYSPALRAARSSLMSLAHGPLREVYHAHGPGGVVIGTRSVCPATTRGAQHVGLRTMCSQRNACFPNSLNPICLHFSRPRSGLVPSAEHFNAGSRSRKHTRLGRWQNTEWISHTASHGAPVRFRNNPVRYTTHVSRLGRSVSHFLTGTHTYYVICTPLTLRHNHAGGLC